MFKKFSLVNEADIPYGISTEVSNTISELYAHMKEFNYKEFTNMIFYHILNKNNIIIKWEDNKINIFLSSSTTVDYELKINNNNFDLLLISCNDIKYFKTERLPLLYNLSLHEIEMNIKSENNISNHVTDLILIGNVTMDDYNVANKIFSEMVFDSVSSTLKRIADNIRSHYFPECTIQFVVPQNSTYVNKFQVVDSDKNILAEYDISTNYNPNTITYKLTSVGINCNRPIISSITIEKNDVEIWSGGKWQKHYGK